MDLLFNSEWWIQYRRSNSTGQIPKRVHTPYIQMLQELSNPSKVLQYSIGVCVHISAVRALDLGCCFTSGNGLALVTSTQYSSERSLQRRCEHLLFAGNPHVLK